MAGFGRIALTKVFSIALVTFIALGLFIPLGTENVSALPTGWTGGVISNEFSYSAAAIDENGALHIIYYIPTTGGSYECDIFYINNITGNWTSPMLIATAHSNIIPFEISIGIGPSLDLHIVHEDESEGHTYLRYCTNQTGTWTVETIEDDMTGV